MSLADLGNLGEFLSALVVVISLLYLAVQIRQNSRLIRASGSQAAAQSALEFNTALISDRELLRIFLAGRKDTTELSTEDRDVFATLLVSLFYTYQSSFYQHEDGVLQPEVWHGLAKMIERLIREEGTAEWWNRSKWLYGAQFRDFVDRQRAA